MAEKFLRTLLVPFFMGLIGLQVVDGLNCYICAEGGLEEFGECKTSFPFSCDGYAKRFPNNEKVFCRTTRHKTFNGSYTVVKECIADSAHHATFPRKSHELEEECDVLDLNGFEVAYCICRSDDLCNDPPIVDQFAAFEEKYPELFDPETTDTPESEPSSPAAQPIERDEEEPENSAELSTNSFASMTPSPTRRPLVDGQVHLPAAGGGKFQHGSDGTSTTEENPFLAPMSETMMGPNGGGGSLLEEGEEGTKGTTNIGAFVTVPIKTTAITAAEPKLPTSPVGSPGTGTYLGTMPELRCMQCSESDLPDVNSDCRNQVMVSCPDQSKVEPGIGRPLCFSRQVINRKTSQHGIEKLCATERAILNEFGSRAVSMLNGAINEDVSCIEQQPASTGASAQRVCICASAMCNRQSVAQQISSLLAFSTQSTFAASTETPPNSKEPTTKPLIQQFEPLNCAVCLDVELRDPQADCRSASSQNCANLIRDEQAYCLTRQTQNGKDSFIVEKSCVSKHQFYQQFPEELQKNSYDKVPLGCATTYDGYVNYCICDGQMCNRNSLAQQADGIGRSHNATNITINKTPKTQLTSSATKSGEHGAKLTNGPQFSLSSQENVAISTTKKSSKSSSEWIQNGHNDDNDDQDSAFKINKHPLPSDEIKDKSTDHHDDLVHTSTSIPSTTTISSATRERLEKWKQNSQPKKPVELDEFETDRSCRNCIGMIGIIAILISIIILLH